eukprot:6235271-Alexandrium_andersonii.AAC.1
MEGHFPCYVCSQAFCSHRALTCHAVKAHGHRSAMQLFARASHSSASAAPPVLRLAEVRRMDCEIAQPPHTR